MNKSFPKCKILRLVETDALMSADVFEENFRDACQGWTDFRYERPQQWIDKVVFQDKKRSQSLRESRLHFQHGVQGYDYVSPGYGGFNLFPLLNILRENCPVNLLFVAHSPAQHVVEMALVNGRLRPGDVIICPSNNARQIIVTLFPLLDPFCVVIPHPIPALSPSQNAKQCEKENRGNLKMLVSLSRIGEDKLIHRQLDALAILHKRGHTHIRMEIAGACHDQRGEPFSYVNELKARVKRLGLEEYVVFKGAITCKNEKVRFLQEADVLINLSRTEEESFGKSCAEAITLGVPVIATHWNGLPETVGECGTCVPLFQRTEQLHFDVDSRVCAEAIHKILLAPPADELFQNQSRKFSFHKAGKKYKTALLGSKKSRCNKNIQKNSPNVAIPVLQAFSQKELDTMYLAKLSIRNHTVNDEQECKQLAARWDIVSNIIFHTTRGRSKLLLAHLAGDQIEPKESGEKNNIPPFFPLQNSKKWVNKVLSLCLDKGDKWTRGVVLSQLAVEIPSLLPWANTVLDVNEGDNFQLIVAVNCLTFSENIDGFRSSFLSLINKRAFSEDDAPILLYLYKQVRGKEAVDVVHRTTGEWLGKYPDAPGSCSLWGLAGPRLLIEEEDIQQRKSLICQLKAVIPKLDISRIDLAHTAIDLL